MTLRLLTVGLVAATLLTSRASQGQDDAPRDIRVESTDAAIIQQALDSLSSTGGIVRLPPGLIEVSEPLVISTPETRVTGAGPSTHIKNTSTSGQPAFHLRSSSRTEDPKAKMWRVQLDNFRLSGNEQSGDGVLAEGIQEIYLHGLSVDHHGRHGINLVDCYEDPRVSDSILTYNKDAGLRIEAGHDIVVNGNHFEENQDAVQCIDSFNLCMNGNNLDDHLRHGVVIENTYGSVVSGNMIEECQGTAIILDRDCYGITLSANVIAHNMGGGIDLRDAHGCAISANTFTLVHDFSVRVGPNSGRLTISANNFSNSHIGEDDPKRPLQHDIKDMIDIGQGIVLQSASHITITGNTFAGLDGPAVTATGNAHKVLVTGNVITDINRRSDAPSNADASFDLGADTDVTLINNITD